MFNHLKTTRFLTDQDRGRDGGVGKGVLRDLEVVDFPNPDPPEVLGETCSTDDNTGYETT